METESFLCTQNVILTEGVKTTLGASVEQSRRAPPRFVMSRISSVCPCACISAISVKYIGEFYENLSANPKFG
jgi:hypothetical protein